MAVLTTHWHPIDPPEAENIIGIGETRGLIPLGSLRLPQIMGLRATGVCYQWLPQCHPGLTCPTDQGILDKVDDIERKEPT